MSNSLAFEDIYQFFRIIGATVIPHRTVGSDSIEVWASTLMSGARKGREVLRIQWQRSSSTLSDSQWKCPNAGTEKNVKRTLEQTLKHSPFVAERFDDALGNAEVSENEKSFLQQFRTSLEEFEPST